MLTGFHRTKQRSDISIRVIFEDDFQVVPAPPRVWCRIPFIVAARKSQQRPEIDLRLLEAISHRRFSHPQYF